MNDIDIDRYRAGRTISMRMREQSNYFIPDSACFVFPLLPICQYFRNCAMTQLPPSLGLTELFLYNLFDISFPAWSSHG